MVKVCSTDCSILENELRRLQLLNNAFNKKFNEGMSSILDDLEDINSLDKTEDLKVQDIKGFIKNKILC